MSTEIRTSIAVARLQPHGPACNGSCVATPLPRRRPRGHNRGTHEPPDRALTAGRSRLPARRPALPVNRPTVRATGLLPRSQRATREGGGPATHHTELATSLAC